MPTPLSLFDWVNRLGAQVDRLIEGNRTSWGTCDQVRVLRALSPKDFWIAWWSPWPEQEPRALHVLHVIGVAPPKDADTLILISETGERWEFSRAGDEAAGGVRDYHRHMATDPERYAELERNHIQAAMNLLPA